jgi:serine protease inhibitor
MYFKGIWKNAFDPQLTSAQCFYDQGTCKKVAMMDVHSMMKYAYIEELRAHAVELPYQVCEEPKFMRYTLLE